SNYGYTNFKWHSLSHCDCDNALKECLRLVNDTSSRVVGQAFFNVIEVPCFEFSFEEQCVEQERVKEQPECRRPVRQRRSWVRTTLRRKQRR
uniref:Uncharacterized LOC107672398 n=1 Tax=Sinocyclocheilus anshuiensis TaxID=1608454 RepID=A0A671PWT0_9TELE